MSLPISGEVHGLASLHCKGGHAAHLIAIRDAAIILAPRRLLRIAKQIRACNVMVNARFSTAQAGETFLGLVGAGTIEALSARRPK
jgi:hypothetical protein